MPGTPDNAKIAPDDAACIVLFLYTNVTLLAGNLWVAPELLRDPNSPPQGTPKGDVYSFAIILQECHTRLGPWSEVDLTCEGIIVFILPPAFICLFMKT